MSEYEESTSPEGAASMSGAQGAARTATFPDLHLVVGGVRHDPVLRDGRAVFRFDLPCGDLRLMSRAARPTDVGVNQDSRLLGYCVRAMILGHAGGELRVPLDHQDLMEGFHDIEQSGVRWTTGVAVLPATLFAGLSGAAELFVEGRPLPKYLADSGAEAALFCRFASLGDDCEFGLAQRAFNAEPNDLLRWVGTDGARIVLGLCRRFEGLGDSSTTRLEWDEIATEYRLRDRLYLNMHTWLSERFDDPAREEEVRLAGCARLRLLRRKLLAEIEAGRRIFVFKASRQDARTETFRAVHAALRGIGPAPLLCVTVAATPEQVGVVEALGDGLYLAHIEQFSVVAISLSTWRLICAATAALVDADPTARIGPHS